MYIGFMLFVIFVDIQRAIKGEYRKLDTSVPKIVAGITKEKLPFVYIKMLFSMLLTGCTFEEYHYLRFYERTIKNQKTFMTTGSNFRAYKKYNDKNFYHIYINKDEFNRKYADYVKRDWICLSEQKEFVVQFFKKHERIIIKPINGHSGYGVFVVEKCNEYSEKEIDELIKNNSTCIAEEIIYNHKVLRELNPTSLNTIRVITFSLQNSFSILFTGVRIGAKGSVVDNLSKGGVVAVIDTVTGEIINNPVTIDNVKASQNIKGIKIPNWDGFLSYMKNVSKVVPEMRYMAWDVAIKEDGFELIEGNHSSGNTITQAHFSRYEDGLKKKFDEIVKSTMIQ